MMSAIRRIQLVVVAVALCGYAADVTAQCAEYDFEEFTIGQAITAQLDGVWFSVVGQSCDGDPNLYMRIADEFYGDSFSSKVLLIQGGCPDFSDDYLRMIFADEQSEVTFALGLWGSPYSYQVRAYAMATGGVPISTQNITIPATGFADARHIVHVQRPTREIRRIEIECSGSGFEAIDDLRFGHDTTPPVVSIDSPTHMECVAGDDVIVTGIACDGDGTYDRDRLDARRVWPNAESDWTLVREYVGSEVCSSNSLYSWDTTTNGVTDGVYLLRATAINACGMSANDEVSVYVDNEFDSLNLRSPLPGAVVGGEV